MFPTRRLRCASSFANWRVAFTSLAVTIFITKSIRVYTRWPVLSMRDVFSWGPSFFAQDVLLLLFLRFLFGKLYTPTQYLRLPLKAALLALTATLLGMATMGIVFFSVTGSEIHWRNITIIRDSSALKMMLATGLCSSAVVLASVLLFSWFVQDSCYNTAGLAVNIVSNCFLYPLRCLSAQRLDIKHNGDLRNGIHYELEHGINAYDVRGPDASKTMKLPHILVGMALLALLSMVLIRPNASDLSALAWTLPLVPFVEFLPSTTKLPAELTHRNMTALSEPPAFPWLPHNVSGFEDWYEPGGRHYLSAADPLKISNLDYKLLPSLRTALADIDIRHVMIIVLESTREDVFPVRKEGFIWELLADSFPDKTFPPEASERLAGLTPTADFLTGHYDDGSAPADQRGRGGIRARNAFTAGTYTLKSLVGILCGITALAVDFAVECSNHIYQPCLPQIFEAFNMLDHSEDRSGKEFTSFKWKSSFMQSVTGGFDRQNKLMPAMGYADETLITREYLKSDDAKFGPVDVPDNNYFGMPEIVLDDYIRDTFTTAAQNNERVFLTHLTSTSHHPFSLPLDENEDLPSEDEPLEKRSLGPLSSYLNTIGYVDQWLNRILGILEEQDVANETLVVFIGDHGLSIAEEEAITAYENPNIANFHVPLVLSHPKLPEIDIEDAVISLQVLPTILDILLETGSLSKSESRAARDLLQNYEGQSLLRPLQSVSSQTGQANWQFSVMNPGGSMLAVRDGRQPNWRLIVPLLDDYQWRFTDISLDPHERSPIVAYDLGRLITKVQETYGPDSSGWVEEAANITGWWIEENRRRWRYDPDAD